MERLSAKSKYDMIKHLITPFQRHFLTLRVYMINLITLQINCVNSQYEKVSLKESYEMLNHITFGYCRLRIRQNMMPYFLKLDHRNVSDQLCRSVPTRYYSLALLQNKWE